MTIYDISQKAGVSIATVSRVMNGNTNVSPKTKQRVLDVIKECGYSPNAFARGLGLNSMHAVGIVCADCSDMFLAKAIHHVEQELRSAGYEGILCSSGYDLEGKQEALQILLQKHVDSIILIGSHFLYEDDESNEYIREAAKSIPIMMLNADSDCPNIYCVFCDDFKATYDTTSYLIDRGAKRILHLYESTSYSGRRKLAGYQSCILAHDMPLDIALCAHFEGDRESATEIASYLDSLWDDGLRFDAISCSNDYMAMGAIRFARTRHISVPKDMQIIGYNNTVLTTCSYPELTSMDNKIATISNQSVSILLEVLDGKQMPQKTVVSGEIIKRETTR